MDPGDRPERRDPPFTRVALVGVGLIGGSVGLAARARWTQVHVTGIDRREVTREAVSLGAIDTAADSLDAVADADLVLLAAPVALNVAILGELAARLGPATIVTDVGSTKRDIVAAARGHRRLTFVGGHPLAGAATSGVGAARAQLFRGRPWILTPSPETVPEALDRVRRFAQGLGGLPETLDPSAHDRLMAFVSHLPQVVASSLLQTVGLAVGESGLALSGPGLADTTRLASSSGALWAGILASNADHVGEAMDALLATLGTLRHELRGGQAVAETFAASARWRRALKLVGEAARPADVAPAAPALREVSAVRTYLEMTDRPAPGRMPDECRVELVAPCPAAFFRYLYREVGRQWHWLDRLDWTDEQVRAYLADPRIEILGLFRHGAPAGYAELRREADGAVEIVYFGLMPEAIGLGIGGAFLSAALARAWQGPTTRVWLHTCTLDHPNALATYRKRGFRVVREEAYIGRVPA